MSPPPSLMLYSSFHWYDARFCNKSRSIFFLLVQSLLVELLNDAGGDLGQALLRVEGKQLPGQVQRVIQVARFVLALGNKLMLEFLEELQMVEVFLSERLGYGLLTS